MRTLQAASNKDTSPEEDHHAAIERVSKLVKEPKMDSVLSQDASIECKAGLRFNPKEYTVDIDLSEHSRLTEHVREWIKLSKEEQKESLSIWLMDKDRDVVAFAMDIRKKEKKRKRNDNGSKEQNQKRRMDIADGTANDNTAVVEPLKILLP